MDRKRQKGYWSRYYDVADSAWPMAVHSLGFNRTLPYAKNPMVHHPWHHWIDEKEGRKLSTLTLVHVIRGSGVFSSAESGELDVPAGSLIFVFPKVRHSYFCRKETGWDDEWVEVEASALLPALAAAGVSPENPVKNLGKSSRVLHQFRRLFDLARQEVGEGLLAACAYETLVSALEDLKTVSSPALAVERMRMSLSGDRWQPSSSVAAVAQETDCSPSWMRTVFRRETGLSPKQYQLQQRLQRAADLLRATQCSVTEIAEEVGFCSASAFSNRFTREFGCSPREFRKRR